MNILASDYFEKDDKYVFKARNSYVCREFLGLEMCIYCFFVRNKSDDYLLFLDQKSRV